MLKQMIASCLLLLVTVCASAASAQSEPSGKWWRDPGIKAELDLKDGEVKRLDRLFKKSRRRLIDLKNKVEKAQFEYQNLMEAEPLDEAAVNRQFAEDADSVCRARHSAPSEIRGLKQPCRGGLVSRISIT